MIHFKHFLLLTLVFVIALATRPAIGVDPAVPVQIMSSIRDGDVDAALKDLGDAVDQGIAIRDTIYTSLPAASGGVFRALSQLSSDEQYELLEQWTLPGGERDHVRLLAIAVPTDAPPKVFARSIGERPRDTTFNVASVGPMPGMFCNGWMLAQAADDLGRLARLRTSLQVLVDQDVAGASELMMFAQIAGSRGQLDPIRDALQRWAESDEQPLTSEAVVHAAVAVAATTHEPLQPAAETLLERLVERAGEGDAIGLRPLLRTAHAVAVQSHRGQSPPEVLFQNPLKYWIPLSVRSAKEIDRGQRPGVWLTHQQHVLHLAGGMADALLFQYPLAGDFDFICETQEGGSIGTDGGLVFGGLHFQTLGRKDALQVWDADQNHMVTRPSPFARFDERPVFNRVSIRSRDGEVQFESNFHPVWFDTAAASTSPWVGLRSSGTKRPVFRNLRLEGEPTIPREVKLTLGDDLRGWQSGFFGETQPAFGGRQSPRAPDDPSSHDWYMQSGTLIGAAKEAGEASRPGLLQYQRPLLDEESISYEFQLGDQNSVPHPAIGRLAFLLESSGVRVRWITTGDSDWTGLSADNAALEPLNRRGPRPLPLKEGESNRVEIQRRGDNVLLTLNGELIYQRPMEPGPAESFGLYRADRTEQVSVRDVTLTGNWPESIPEEFVKNPVTVKPGI